MCVPYSSESKKCGLSLRVRCILPLLAASGIAETAEIQQPINQLQPTSQKNLFHGRISTVVSGAV